MTTLKPPFTAKDMKSLYMKVVKGWYSSIPKLFSSDLSNTIEMWLRTSPVKRPSADTLLDSDEVQKHLDDIKDKIDSNDLSNLKFNLLNTIKLPKKLLDISKRLPKANYNSPLVTSKRNFDIKIAKGFPDIFDKSKYEHAKSVNRAESVSLSINQTPKIELSPKVEKPESEISIMLRNRLYKKVIKPSTESSHKPVQDVKVKLPIIQRIISSGNHGTSVGYSCIVLNNRRKL